MQAVELRTLDGGVAKYFGKFHGSHCQNRLAVEGEKRLRRHKFGNGGRLGFEIVRADELAFVPKSRRRKIASTYEAAVPAAISHERLVLSAGLVQRMAEVEVAVARFDQEQRGRGYNLPALLLRSESSSSSQIERLTSSVRNVALAELSDKAPANAQLIARNVAAMKKALEHTGPMSVDLICAVHDTLMKGSGEAPGLRLEQVWIGGTPYSPHGASFVPPAFLEDALLS